MNNNLSVISNRLESSRMTPDQLVGLLNAVGYSKKSGTDVFCDRRRFVDKQAEMEFVPTMRAKTEDGFLVLTPGIETLSTKSIAEKLASAPNFADSLRGKSILSSVNFMSYRFVSIDVGTQASSDLVNGGKVMSYAEYYQQKYEVTLNDGKPFLKCRLASGDAVSLPAEYCHLEETEEVLCDRAAVISQLAQSFSGQMVILEKLAKAFNSSETSKWFEKNKVSIGKELISARMRELPKLAVNMKLPEIDLSKIVVLLPKEATIEEHFCKFSGYLEKVANEMGKKINMETVHYTTTLKESLEAAFAKGPALAIIVIDGMDPVYAKVKMMGISSQTYVPTQVLTFNTLRQSVSLKDGLSSPLKTARSLLCQIAAKMGPVTWITPALQMPSTMVVGLSVGPTRYDGQGGKRSFAMVSSHNDKFNSWTSRCSDNYGNSNKRLSSTFRKALRSYTEVNQLPPTSILIFREGETNMEVLQREVQVIKDDIEAIRKLLNFTGEVRFSMFAVAKTNRVYAEKLSDSRFRSLSCGGFVEHRNSFDLISGNDDVTQICEYKVVHEAFGVDAYTYADFASKLSFGYAGGGCGTPSLFPSPVQYAIKLRRFIKMIDYKKAKESLEAHQNRLFYL